MIRLEFIYVLMGVMVAGVALVNLFDAKSPRRLGNTAFWGLYAVSFLAGSHLPDLANGCLVILMVTVATVRGIGPGNADTTAAADRRASALRWGNRLFIPALLIPAITVSGTLWLKDVTIGGAPFVDPRQVTLVSLALATIVALAVGMVMLRPPALAPAREARRLLDTVGWAAVLPQMLAALGALFAAAGVGQIVATLATRWIPLNHAFVAVATFTVGMAVFTMIMGNAFAAFPVMTAGIGLPVIVGHFHGNPVVMAAIGMLAGYSGTLMTPMAANFNIVPAALLELPDQNAVIKVQVPTGIAMLIVNTLLLYFLVFRV